MVKTRQAGTGVMQALDERQTSLISCSSLSFAPVEGVCYCLVAKLCPTLLRPHGLQPARPLCPWDFSGKNTGVGCHFLLQGIFPTQEWNLCLLHQEVDSLLLNHLGSHDIQQLHRNCYYLYSFSWEPILHCVSRDSLEISELYIYISSFEIAFPS